MSDAHIVELPKAVWYIKIAQGALSVLMLALSAYVTAEYGNTGSNFAIFTSLYTMGIIAYYFVALHAQRAIYNWIALLVLESLAVVWWLSTWAVLAAMYVTYSYGVVCGYYYCSSYGASGAVSGVWKFTIVLGVIQFILFCVTLGFMAMGVHRHRIAGKPMMAGGSFGASTPWTAADKTEMQSMPAGQTNIQNAQPAHAHPNVPPLQTYNPNIQPPHAYQGTPQYVQNPQPAATSAAYEQSPVSPYSEYSPYTQGPPPEQNAHEMYASNRY